MSETIGGAITTVSSGLIEGAWVSYSIEDPGNDIRLHANEVEALRYAVNEGGRRVVKVRYEGSVSERVLAHATSRSDGMNLGAALGRAMEGHA